MFVNPSRFKVFALKNGIRRALNPNPRLLKMKKIIFITFTLILHFSAHSAESDHYSRAGEKIQDANKQVSLMARKMVAEVLRKLNQEGTCEATEEKALYKELREVFANHSKGKLVKEILYTDKFPTQKIPLGDSIFKEWSILNGYLLGKKGAADSPLALAPLIRLGESVVGVDKIEHLFGMGYQYFDRHHMRGHTLKRVLKRGIFFEKTILGGNIIATGVFSYADLAANFNGMRFWNHVLQKRDDVLGASQNIGPYLTCENDKWVQVKEIDFSYYLDGASDESINCSKLASKGGVEKYKRYMKDLGMECPRRKDLLSDIYKKYSAKTQGDRLNRPISHWILNEGDVEKVSYFNEF